jgi:maltose alpha-D-glucosyltransferase/alpha-amylase
VSNWTWDPVAKAYYWHRFYSHQPDLNFDNPLVLDEVKNILRFWLDIGVDGFRLDAVPYLVEREGTHGENLPETHDVLKMIRAEVDRINPECVLLAEANQHAKDTMPYFGRGDECHMAFHFPLMPRVFMALADEDSSPIVDIVEKTMRLPEPCQWALFLRNHDELTLEMVTDDEREKMWEIYATHERLRINLGIRRRLATLLDGDRRRIELLTGLLLSLPGTPVIYYGDEIGMGDNPFLGDRDCVRTPMQWSPDRNAGFSRAEGVALYLPPIVDSQFGYQAVNVELEQKLRASLLNWTRWAIRVRNRHQTFGRGDFRILATDNRRVMVYLRCLGDEVLLCAANLAETSQAVEIDLSDRAGQVPVDLFGGAVFPAIGEHPYVLTLPGHGFYWLEVVSAEEGERRRAEPPDHSGQPPLPEAVRRLPTPRE